MKTIIITVLAITASFNMSFANVTPISELSIITTSTYELSVTHASQKAFFKVSNYNEANNTLEFVTADVMNYIQIFDEEGKLKYQLPVMSKKLKISTKLFRTGAYKIGFITKDNTTIQFTNLTVNK